MKKVGKQMMKKAEEMMGMMGKPVGPEKMGTPKTFPPQKGLVKKVKK